MAQLVTRLDDELLGDVDRLVRQGVVASRSDAVRTGLRTLIDHQRRRQIAGAIVAGYRQHAQVEADVGWSDAASAAMIAAEPW